MEIKKQLLLMMIILFTLTETVGCDNDDVKKESIEAKLLGTWIEKKPYNDGICDTLVFKEDNTVELYSPLEGWTYHLLSDSSITFSNQEKKLNQSFDFSLQNDELVIYNFIDRSISEEIKNISFIKE